MTRHDDDTFSVVLPGHVSGRREGGSHSQEGKNYNSEELHFKIEICCSYVLCFGTNFNGREYVSYPSGMVNSKDVLGKQLQQP